MNSPKLFFTLRSLFASDPLHLFTFIYIHLQPPITLLGRQYITNNILLLAPTVGKYNLSLKPVAFFSLCKILSVD